MNDEIDVSVVVLNWNAAEDTLRCARSLSGWQRLRVRLYVVDNASQDDSLARLRAELPPSICLIANATNLGFAGGVNSGIRAALTESDAPLLLLNNDAAIAEADLQRLLTLLHDEPSVGIVGPVVYHAAPPHAVISAGNRSPALLLNTLITHAPPGAPVYDVDYISGSVALIRAEALNRAGWLDEDYFFHTEVADFCRRARRLGWRCVVDAQARAYHDLARSAPLRGTLYIYYLIRNRFIYIRKFYGWTGWLIGALWAVYVLLLAAKLAVQGNAPASRAVIMALMDGLGGRWGGQNARVLAASGVQAAPAGQDGP
ncbi:MAG: glycosyltransferase family 2 protein [Caldilineaceae bacterium]|nr:glycosyltransferase family 2 protein [Caldilineaceae bacterium]